MMRVLFVCTGNVCRSPFAVEALHERTRGLAVEVAGAGTHAAHGRPVAPEMVGLAERFHLDAARLSRLRARQLSDDHIRASDLVLTMTRSQRHEVVGRVPARVRSTFTLREFVRLSVAYESATGLMYGAMPPRPLEVLLDELSAYSTSVSDGEDDIADPYGGPADGYERAAVDILLGVHRVAQLLRTVPGVTAGAASSRRAG